MNKTKVELAPKKGWSLRTLSRSGEVAEGEDIVTQTIVLRLVQINDFGAMAETIDKDWEDSNVALEELAELERYNPSSLLPGDGICIGGQFCNPVRQYLYNKPGVGVVKAEHTGLQLVSKANQSDVDTCNRQRVALQALLERQAQEQQVLTQQQSQQKPEPQRELAPVAT